MSVQIVDTDSIEPVSLEDVRKQCRIDDDVTEEDSLLELYLVAAREYCENFTGRFFSVRNFRFDGLLNAFREVELAHDLVKIDSIKLIDRSGNALSISENQYVISRNAGVGSVRALGEWPECNTEHPAPITIMFTAGKESCPSVVKQAILLLASSWYENRDLKVTASILESVTLLLNEHRLVKV